MRTFETDDALSRKQFSDFLLHLIEHRSEYKRDNQFQNYSIAIDGSYGSGKTYFLEMFESKLKEKEKYNIIRYDAWKFDIYQDAISPFLYLLENEDLFIDAQNEQDVDKKKKKLHTVIKKVLVAVTSIGAKAILGSSFDAIIDSMKDATTNEIKDESESDFEKKLKVFNLFKQALGECCSEEHPLIFLIDELDRCSPEFALKTFEVVKHLIDVPNVIFIFALDITQLKSAIHHFYGDSIDADGYIFKLFDYIAVLPHPSIADYIKEKSGAIDTRLTESVNFQEQANILSSQCSLREIDTLFCVYHLLWDIRLKTYAEQEAWILYFFLLFLKYKHRDCFSALLKETTPLSTDIQSKLAPYRNLSPCHPLLSYSKKLMNRDNLRISFDGKGNDYLYSVDEQKGIATAGVSPTPFGARILHRADQASGYPYTIHGIFFWEDFKNVLKADKHLTFGQYLHQQLEMFDFSEAIS